MPKVIIEEFFAWVTTCHAAVAWPESVPLGSSLSVVPQQTLTLILPIQCKGSAVHGWQLFIAKTLEQHVYAHQPLVMLVIEIAEGLQLCS